MRRLGVGADADHLGAGVLEVLVLVAEGARFLRAARRVVLRIEVEDDRLLAAVVAELHRAAAPVREREVGRRVADADAGGAATEQVEESHAPLGYHHRRPRPTRGSEDADRADQRRPPARRAAHGSASPSRSLPQKSSSPTTAVGAPKMPRAIARSVSARRRAFASGAPAASTSARPGRPSTSRMAATVSSLAMSRSSAKLAWNTARTKSPHLRARARRRRNVFSQRC